MNALRDRASSTSPPLQALAGRATPLLAVPLAKLRALLDPNGSSASIRMWDPAALAGPRHRTLFACDIAGFGRRTEPQQQRVRAVMYDLLQSAFVGSGIGWPNPPWREDRGDGAIVALPAEIAPQEVLDNVVQRLVDDLVVCNSDTRQHCPLTLRVAVHAGFIGRDDFGFTGRSIVDLARLLDAPAFKKLVLTRSANLGLIVSSYLYQQVVCNEYCRMESNQFERLAVNNKELRTEAWVHLDAFSGLTAIPGSPSF